MFVQLSFDKIQLNVRSLLGDRGVTSVFLNDKRGAHAETTSELIITAQRTNVYLYGQAMFGKFEFLGRCNPVPSLQD